eukprot:scaffold9763_cov95-Isochrysis_galbana.AAC.2
MAAASGQRERAHVAAGMGGGATPRPSADDNWLLTKNPNARDETQLAPSAKAAAGGGEAAAVSMRRPRWGRSTPRQCEQRQKHQRPAKPGHVAVGLGDVQQHVGDEQRRNPGRANSHRRAWAAAPLTLPPPRHIGALATVTVSDPHTEVAVVAVAMNWKTTKFDEVSMNKIWSEHVRGPLAPKRPAGLVRSRAISPAEGAVLSGARCLARAGHQGVELLGQVAQDQIHAEPIPVNSNEQRPRLTW